MTDTVPDPTSETDAVRSRAMSRALSYRGLQPGTKLVAIPISHALIGSCTNACIEDLRDAARVVDGRKIAPGVRGIIVPDSTAVREQAETEGLADIFRAVGFEWRQSGLPGDERRRACRRGSLRLVHQPQLPSKLDTMSPIPGC